MTARRVWPVAPSGPATKTQLDRLPEGAERLRRLGLDVRDIGIVANEVWLTWRSAAERCHELLSAIAAADDGDLIWCITGGKNANDLVDLLMDAEIPHAPAVKIVGFSDNAIVLNVLAFRHGLAVSYGPDVLANIGKLTDDTIAAVFTEHSADGRSLLAEVRDVRAVTFGTATGRLYGGSLGTLAVGLAGSEVLPPSTRVVLFFESSGFDELQIRQHLVRLLRDLHPDRVAGLVIGATPAVRSNELLEELVLDLLPSRPYVRGSFFGHGPLPNRPLPIGQNVVLEVGSDDHCSLRVV
jgi:muramoyltetrapeptide carboxypeptidase LdcA involved in peptidoglycan recycling